MELALQLPVLVAGLASKGSSCHLSSPERQIANYIEPLNLSLAGASMGRVLKENLKRGGSMREVTSKPVCGSQDTLLGVQKKLFGSELGVRSNLLGLDRTFLGLRKNLWRVR